MACIDIPKLPPLLFNKNGRHTYVCTYKNKWDPKLKRAVRVKGQNVTVGKIAGGGLTGIIQWSEAFLELYPALKQLQAKRCIDDKAGSGSRVKYYLDFSAVPRNATDDNMSCLKQLSACHIWHAGATWLLDKIIESTPLSKALYATFTDDSVALKLLSLAYFKVLEPSKDISLYEDFAKSTRLPYKRSLNTVSIAKLLEHIDQVSIDCFLKNLHKFTQETEDSRHRHIYYALDAGSFSPDAQDLSRAGWRHNKDTDTLDKKNVVLLFNQRTGCPLYYRVFSGLDKDVATISFLLKEYAGQDLKRTAILLAGSAYGKVKNIHRLYQCHQSFIINVKTCFSICKNLIAQNLNYLLDPCNYNLSISQSVYTQKMMWSYPVTNSSTVAGYSKEQGQMYVHIYLNHAIRNAAEDFFREKMAQLVALKASDPQSLGAEESEFLKTYTIKDSRANTVVNTDKKFEYMLTKGISILICDSVSDPVEAYRAYQERNAVERSFGTLKDLTSELKISASKILPGTIVLHFLSCSILSMLRGRIKACKDKGISLPYATEEKILSALSNITQISCANGECFLEITEKNKQLFECLSIPMPEAKMHLSFKDNDSVDKTKP